MERELEADPGNRGLRDDFELENLDFRRFVFDGLRQIQEFLDVNFPAYSRSFAAIAGALGACFSQPNFGNRILAFRACEGDLILTHWLSLINMKEDISHNGSDRVYFDDAGLVSRGVRELFAGVLRSLELDLSGYFVVRAPMDVLTNRWRDKCQRGGRVDPEATFFARVRAGVQFGEGEKWGNVVVAEMEDTAWKCRRYVQNGDSPLYVALSSDNVAEGQV